MGHAGAPSNRTVTQSARPFLKWAGGKSQLLEQFEPHFPRQLKEGKVRTYVEPFVGAGAVFFHIAQRYPLDRAYLLDINAELCLAYRVLKRAPRKLAVSLEQLQSRYLAATPAKREKMFYRVRGSYNSSKSSMDYRWYRRDWVQRAAQLIFLNKTCYNGLYRTNSRGEFNAPFGRYRNPTIFAPKNLSRISRLLAKAEILCDDFEGCEELVDARTFVYFDPPYRPLSRTASFTSYSGASFNDQEQRRLGMFYRRLHENRHGKLMLSNSDPANVNPRDRFFEQLYRGFALNRVRAARMINSVAARRGQITELVITNY